MRKKKYKNVIFKIIWAVRNPLKFLQKYVSKKIPIYKELFSTSIQYDDINYSQEEKEFYDMCIYFNKFLDNQYPVINKYSNKKSVIIETRNLPHLEFIIKNTIQRLGDGWGHIIFCSKRNYRLIKKITRSISLDITVVILKKDIHNINDYNNLLLDKKFWNQLNCKKVLIYQSDTFIFKKLDPVFLKYDYIGAPWNESIQESFKEYSKEVPYFGNGGLSIRNVDSIIKILSEYNPHDKKFFPLKNKSRSLLDVLPEDVFFSIIFFEQRKRFKLPNKDIVNAFSYENIPFRNTFGVHQPYLHLHNFKKRFFGVNIIGFINSNFGLGKYSRLIYSLLEHAQVPCSLYEIECLQKRSNYLTVDNKLIYPITIFSCNPDSRDLLQDTMFQNSYNIGYWFWELEKLPDDWKEFADKFDELWVATDFLKSVFQKELPLKKIKKISAPFDIPNFVDKNKARRMIRHKLFIKETDFVFLFVFDFFSDPFRKNPQALIKAFQLFISKYDTKNIKLIIKSQNANNEQIYQITDLIQNHANIIFINELFSHNEINMLMNSCDVYVSPHRSEGLGMTIAEAILLEKPAIATNYSGNLDFCLSDCVELVDSTMIPIQDNSFYKTFFKSGQIDVFWADPDIFDIAKKMERIYNNYDFYKEKTKKNKSYILQKYNLDKNSLSLQKTLKNIYYTINHYEK